MALKASFIKEGDTSRILFLPKPKRFSRNLRLSLSLRFLFKCLLYSSIFILFDQICYFIALLLHSFNLGEKAISFYLPNPVSDTRFRMAVKQTIQLFFSYPLVQIIIDILCLSWCPPASMGSNLFDCFCFCNWLWSFFNGESFYQLGCLISTLYLHNYIVDFEFHRFILIVV